MDFFYMGNTTMTLESAIRNIGSFDEFEQRFTDKLLDDDKQVCHYLADLVFKYAGDYATVSQKAGYAAAYLGNIINGHKNNPSRDVLIAICLTLGTTVEEIQQLLKYAGHAPLYVRRKRDVIIWFGFMKGLSADDVDDLLIERDYKPVTNLYKK